MAGQRLFDFPWTGYIHQHVRINVKNISAIELNEHLSPPNRWCVTIVTPGMTYVTEFSEHAQAHEFFELWSSRVEDAK